MRAKGTTDDVRKNARSGCSVEGCDRPHQALGLCENHWRANRHKRVRVEIKAKAERSCPHCGTIVDPQRRWRGPISYCSRECKEAAYIADGRAAAVSLRAHYRNSYGLTMDEVEVMRAKGCGICGTVEWMGRHSQAHIDHDHATGRVRGVLCHDCNTGLGKFRDDPELLAAAIRYLTT
jgi:hypothetical protein